MQKLGGGSGGKGFSVAARKEDLCSGPLGVLAANALPHTAAACSFWDLLQLGSSA